MKGYSTFSKSQAGASSPDGLMSYLGHSLGWGRGNLPFSRDAVTVYDIASGE